MMIQLQPTKSDLQGLAERLEGQSPEEILRWALDQYRGSITLACSFGGITGMVLLDMVLTQAPRTPVFYLDTGMLFPETYALIDQVAQRYGVEPSAIRPEVTVPQQAAAHGDALWSTDPDRCCAIRKVEPQRRALDGYSAWITGLRRDQSATRRATPVVGWDAKFNMAKIAPLAAWTDKEIWSYIFRHDVPYNALHDRGYPSIGCTHCTRPVLAGEDERSGRWSGHVKTECGLHTPPERIALT